MIKIDPHLKLNLKKDIDTNIKSWKVVLDEFFDIEYCYAKGSAVKPWASIIDYVPVLSDVDIHFRVKNIIEIGDFDIQTSLQITKRHQEEFNKLRPEPFHIPRSQVLFLDLNKNIDKFVSPNYDTVEFLIGTKDKITLDQFTDTEIKQMDKENLLETQSYLDTLPNSIFDRVGLDFWQLLRRMNWRISPSVARLLSQQGSPSRAIWDLNRTVYYNMLLKHGFDKIANSFKMYYEKGWDLFKSDFRDDDIYREVIYYGTQVMSSCIQAVS